MFSNCKSLIHLDLSGWDTSKVTSSNNTFFFNCTRLESISVSNSWKWLPGGYLPTPSSSYIAGADGSWYAESDGASYAASAVPSYKADTYYASKALRDAAVGAA